MISGPRTRGVLALMLLAAFLVGFATMSPASAHRADESYLYFDIGDDDLRGDVQLSYPDVREVLGLELEGTDDEIRAEIESNLALLQGYALENTEVAADGVALPLQFAGYELLEDDPIVEEDGQGFIILPFVVDLGGEAVPEQMELTFTPFLAEIDDRNNLALVANDWKRGVIDVEADEILVFNAANTSGSVTFGESSQWKNFDASIDLGIDHIRTGPDHIFFIFALLLPSVLILRGRREWAPAPNFGGSLLRVLIVATMFTLAHSITFTLAGLDFIPLPDAKLTETLIAVSIVIAALNNLWPVLGHREWAIAFVFGLFHGLGFAGFVEDLEITRTTQLVSLLGRNVGIEIGQAVIVLITFPALWFLSRTRWYRPFFVTATLSLAAVSTVWVFERLFEADAGINDWVDRVVKWPRAFWLCVLAAVVAGALAAIERNRADADDDLEPPDDGGPDLDDELVGAPV